MKKIIYLIFLQFIALAVPAQQKVGINNPSPGYALDVFDAANQGFFINFNSNNTGTSFVQIGNNAPVPNTANIGMGFYRNGVARGYVYADGNNNIILSATGGGSPYVVLSPAGNVGIGRFDPGFPLNFANVLGDKISMWGNSGNSYGFGIQSNLLQIHTDGSGSDIAFGYGSSAAMTERMRIKGNGYVGIATNNPQARLHVVQAGLYTRTEGAGNALEIRDTTGTDHILYMGADATNQLSFIQSVATGGYRDLLLQGRGGNVIVGRDQGMALSVKGDLVVDYSGSNTGTISNVLKLGSAGSGEGIGSKRNAGGNVNGLDFYTASVSRLQISNGGNVTIPGNVTMNGSVTISNYQALVSDMGGVRQKMLLVDQGIFANSAPQGFIGDIHFPIGPGTFTGRPVAWVTSYVSNSGDCHKVVITTEVVADGAGWDLKLHTSNTSPGSINFNGVWKIAIMGSY